MAVPNVPFWLSQANTEFQANGWASNIMGKAGVPVPGWCSQLAGKSAYTPTHTITIAHWSGILTGVPMWGCSILDGTGAISPDAFNGYLIWGLNYSDVNAFGNGGVSLTTQGGQQRGVKLTIPSGNSVVLPALAPSDIGGGSIVYNNGIEAPSTPAWLVNWFKAGGTSTVRLEYV